jgi:hypothetical protein
MPHAKLAVALCATAILLCGCGSVITPADGRGHVDDPRIDNPDRLACLQHDKLPVQLVGKTGIQIGPLPSGPTVRYLATDGAAQGVQIAGEAQGAEVIGAAIVYPHGANDSEMTKIETCLAKGVSG